MQRLSDKAANIPRSLFWLSSFVRWVFAIRSEYIANNYCEQSSSPIIRSIFARHSQWDSFSVRVLLKPADQDPHCFSSTLWINLNCLIDPDKEIFERTIVSTFLALNLNMCFGCSKEPSHQEIKKIVFQYTLLPGGLEISPDIHIYCVNNL